MFECHFNVASSTHKPPPQHILHSAPALVRSIINSLPMSFRPICDSPPSLESAFAAPLPHPSVCAWAASCVGGKIRLGCSIPMAPPVDGCMEIGCTALFHHCCQTEWEMAQYRHDFPDGDVSDCKYESRGKYCLAHHPNGEYARPSTVDNDEGRKVAAPAAGRTTRETAASRKKKEMIEFVSKQRIDNVILNSDNTDVDSLGGVSWSKLTVDAKREFAKVNNISVPQSMRTGADLGKVIANWINSIGYREMVVAVVKKKAPGSTTAATKPTCITTELTLFMSSTQLWHVKLRSWQPRLLTIVMIKTVTSPSK